MSVSKTRLTKQAIYSSAVFVLGFLLFFLIPDGMNTLTISWPFVILCILCFLMVWNMGMPMPYIGLVSMERVVQVFLLLTIDFHQAALINTIAAFIWPFTNKKYNHSSLTLSVIKAVHNAGMVAIMMLLAGSLQNILGLSLPLMSLEVSDILVITIIALALQILNFSILGIFYYLDGKKVLELFRPVNLVIEMIFVPLGVLSAVLFNQGETELFVTLCFFSLIVLYAFYFNVFSKPKRASLSEIRSQGYDHNNFKSVIADLAENVKSLMTFDSFYIAMIEEGNEVDVVYQIHRTKKYPLTLMFDEIQAVVTERRHINKTFFHDDLECESTLMIVPLVHHSSVFGILCLQTYQGAAYLQSDESVFSEIANKYSMTISYARAYEILENRSIDLENLVEKRTLELKKANNEKQTLLDELTEKSNRLKQLSELDPLTGLYNRRYFNQYIESLLSTQGLSVMLLDIDWFKTINDEFGHLVGDEVLIKLSEILKSELPQSSIICRYGGEEFLILFENPNHDKVRIICEQLRSSIELSDWSFVEPGRKITVSMGLQHSSDNSKIHQLIEKADKNLYAAKEAGRNRLVSA